MAETIGVSPGNDTVFPIRAMLERLNMLSGDDNEYAQQLIESERRSVEIIERLTADIRTSLTPATDYRDIDIVACGSMARHEWTLASDFDYLIVVRDPSAVSSTNLRAVQRKMLEIIRDNGLSEPGATGTFGQPLTSFDLTSKIGLETDTNAVTTRRVLMLEESVSLRLQVQHQELIERILDRYLSEYRRPTSQVARLILNDVVKYWRILAVDYSSKNWIRTTDDGWGLRYLKLRITRKLAFSGMLAAMFDIKLKETQLTSQALYGNLAIPALARLGLLYDKLEDRGKEALQKCLILAGRFNMMLDDKEFREQASGIDWDGMETKPPKFREAEQISIDIQGALEELFFEGSSELGALTRKYGVF